MIEDGLALALRCAAGGDAVVWVEARRSGMREAFSRAVVNAGMGARACRRNGHEAIDFESGGRIVFVAVESHGHRGQSARYVFARPSVLAKHAADLAPIVATFGDRGVIFSTLERIDV